GPRGQPGAEPRGDLVAEDERGERVPPRALQPLAAGERRRQDLHGALARDVAMALAELDPAPGQPVEQSRRPPIPRGPPRPPPGRPRGPRGPAPPVGRPPRAAAGRRGPPPGCQEAGVWGATEPPQEWPPTVCGPRSAPALRLLCPSQSPSSSANVVGGTASG